MGNQQERFDIKINIKNPQRLHAKQNINILKI